MLLEGSAMLISRDSVPDAGPYNIFRLKNLDVRMRDGIRLSTDIYLPVKNEAIIVKSWPAVMTRTAYDKSGMGFVNRASFFASHGYMAVTQDVRGTFASEGEFFPFINEVDDGLDTLEWLLKHPSCNEKVGMYGCSYMGWVQLALATQNPKGLCCMIPFGTAIDTYHHYAYPGGGLQLGMIRWVIYDVWRRAARDNPRAIAAIEKINFQEFASELPWKCGETILAECPQFEDVIFSYLENRTYNAFWKQAGQAFDLYFKDFPDIPIMWVSGWYDGYPRSCCEGYRKMKELGREHNQYLLLGPWVHNQMSGNVCNEADFSPDADISRNGVQLDFFNRHLKDDHSVEIPKVRVFLMGGGTDKKSSDAIIHHGGKWIRDTQWPPSGMEVKPLYLYPEGKLDWDKPELSEDTFSAYDYDPEKPVPSISPPWQFPDHAPRGPADQREPVNLLGQNSRGRKLADRSDVLVFRTDFLKKDISVLGPLKVKLYVSSSALDTDFTVKLIDVIPPNDHFPEGYDFPVCEGFQRMSYRNGDTGLELMEPGRIYEIDIECFPAANKFCKGHRIRLDISSSNYPRFDLNNNTGDPSVHKKLIARNAVHFGENFPAHIMLPVISA